LAHAAWLGADWQNDARQTAAYLVRRPDWLVVDHYAIDRNWEEVLRTHCRKLMVIDDLADRSHDCDVLLDQNFLPGSELRYKTLVPRGAHTLIGPRYALLRSEFALNGSDFPERAHGDILRLLVMFGGADQGRQTEKVLRLLAGVSWQGPVDVVAGPLYPEMQALHEAVAALPSATLHVASENIALLMRKADLALGAPGVTSLERCACALPSLTVAHARNQEAIGVALAEAGAHWYLGREADASDADWLDALSVLARHRLIRHSMSVVASTICDGQGAQRVAVCLLLAAMNVRKADKTDSELLFAWRNDARTRRLSRDPSPLDRVVHLRWVAKTLENPDIDLLLIGMSGRDMACVRFDCRGDLATLSIYVDPDLQGQGIGRAALQSAIDWLRAHRPDLKLLFSNVLEANHASHQMFRNSGFVPDQTSYAFDLQT
jgi:UDP-2,4-diacetamido-2,4,6-trideoxy-beta-L-altropyranose hydrolase